MPTYLLHGFRWPRRLIRIHIILNNLDDAASEWLMAPATTNALLENFKEKHGALMASLPNLRFIEEYDPNDTSSKSRPYAYVADIVHEVELGVDVDEVRGKGVSNEAWGALVDLRDALAPGEKVAWFVVVCGDVERWAPPTNELFEGSLSQQADGRRSASTDNGEQTQRSGNPRSFRKWFSRTKNNSVSDNKLFPRSQPTSPPQTFVVASPHTTGDPAAGPS